VEGAEGEDTEAVLNRLRSLEEEKRRFESMLSDSQSQHEDLLTRLSDMRSLMTALGLKEEDLDLDADDDDNQDA